MSAVRLTLEPFDGIRVGDVIRWNRRLRTVRGVGRYADGRIRSVTFAKVARSQYRRPLTVYWRPELRAAFGGIVARRKGRLCATDVECELTRWIEAGEPWDGSRVTQEQTVGVIW